MVAWHSPALSVIPTEPERKRGDEGSTRSDSLFKWCMHARASSTASLRVDSSASLGMTEKGLGRRDSGALAGRFRSHHAFMLSQLLADLDYLEESMRVLSEQIEQCVAPFAPAVERLCTIPGVKRATATAIVAELGTDVGRFVSAQHLASWAGMSPGNKQSAGKRHRAKARNGNRWLRTALVESGNAAGRSRDTALAAVFRRMLVRNGRKHAAFVVGHHILRIAYHLLSENTTYR